MLAERDELDVVRMALKQRDGEMAQAAADIDDRPRL